MSQILIIGWGNVLRADDAVGFLAAEQLQQLYRDDPGVQVIASHQLMPEMALDIAGSGSVVFLDASSAEEPGTISQTRILPETVKGGFTHQLTPAALMSLAGQLYGHVPEAIGITLAGWSFKLSNKLSRRAGILLPVLVAQARNAVETRRQISGVPALVK